MFGLDSPRLLGSRPAVLAATLPSNKFYLLYILPCVWKLAYVRASPRLLGSRPTVLAATLPSNKFYLLYVLPCVWKFFSNPLSDYNIHQMKKLIKGGERVKVLVIEPFVP